MQERSQLARRARKPRAIGSLVIVWLFLRLVLARVHELVPDEAYYWTWSRHPAWGYLDHPPMIAWLIRLGTWLAGTNELGVRTAGAFLAAGTILVIAGLTRRVSKDQELGAGILAAIILIASPLMTLIGAIATPDGPMCFSSACAMACAIAVFLNGNRLGWIGFGVCWGLALLSKYPAIFVGVAIFLALLSDTRGRAELKTIWPWAGAALAGIIFSPVIAWNATHQWASFKFQLNHGTTSTTPVNPLKNIGMYLAGQQIQLMPVLTILGYLLLIHMARRWKELNIVDRILFFSAALPLVVFGITSVRHEPEVNWPVFAYLPITVLLARQAWENKASQWYGWTKIGIIVAAVAMVVVQAPEIMNWIPADKVKTIPRRWRDLYAWDSLARGVEEMRLDSPVYASTYETAAELEFYLPDQPNVWTMEEDRITQFDYFAGRPDPLAQDRIVFVRRWPSQPGETYDDPIPQDIARAFRTIDISTWNGFALGRPLAGREIIAARK